MNSTTFKIAVAALVVVSSAAISDAQTRRTTRVAPRVTTPQAGSGERGLVGVNLFDSGVRVINIYGNPSEIWPVTIGGGSSGPVGQQGAGRSAGSGGGFAGGPPAGGGGGAAGGAASAQWQYDFMQPQFDPQKLNQDSPNPGVGKGGGGQGGPPGAPSAAGASGGGGPAGPGGAPGGGGGGAAGQGESVLFTRWVYNRGGSRYSFIMNKYNQVVQIEAVGLTDGKVRTRGGVGLGATFADVQRKYGAPDAYEISGDNIMMKYLTRRKVAFRLSRVQQGKPQRVTGIVVAAGSS